MPERIPPFASRLIWLPVLLGLLSFAYGVNNDFIYDDNVLLRERLSADVSVSSLWTTDYWADGSGLYRPVTLLALRLELGVFGLHPAGFHIVSLLLHAAAAGLVDRKSVV